MRNSFTKLFNDEGQAVFRESFCQEISYSVHFLNKS